MKYSYLILISRYICLHTRNNTHLIIITPLEDIFNIIRLKRFSACLNAFLELTVGLEIIYKYIYDSQIYEVHYRNTSA